MEVSGVLVAILRKIHQRDMSSKSLPQKLFLETLPHSQKFISWSLKKSVLGTSHHNCLVLDYMTGTGQVHVFHTIAVEDEHCFSQNNYFQGSAELGVDLKHVHTYPYTCYSQWW